MSVNVANLIDVMLYIGYHQHVFTLNVFRMNYVSQLMLIIEVSMMKYYIYKFDQFVSKQVLEKIFVEKIFFLESTAAAIDVDDPGSDECSATKSCSINEQCEQVSINAQLKRNVCVCNRENGYRRINGKKKRSKDRRRVSFDSFFFLLGVCRQYLSRTKPCALYEKDYELNNDGDEDVEGNNRGLCRKNEECLPPNDRAKHGYCQCKTGFIRKTDNGLCIPDKRDNLLTTSTKSTSISLSSSSSSSSSSTSSSSIDIEVQAGDDQTITLPTNQVDLNGHIIYKSNKSEINLSELDKQNLTLSWSLKSSTNDAKIDISNQDELTSHILVKHLREGIYEFEFKLNNKQGLTLASDIVKIEVLSTKTTIAPLSLKVISPISIRLPQQSIKIESQIEPSNRQVIYQWTYLKGGPVTPTLEVKDNNNISF